MGGGDHPVHDHGRESDSDCSGAVQLFKEATDNVDHRGWRGGMRGVDAMALTLQGSGRHVDKTSLNPGATYVYSNAKLGHEGQG